MPKQHDDVLGVYADQLKNWPKQLGPKPTRESFATVHHFARPGKQAMANAMAMRPEGVTGSEIIMACGAPQLNKMRDLIRDGVVKREALPQRNGHTVYKLSLTAKGQQVINGKVKTATAQKATKPAPSKPAKAKAARKPKAAKVTAPAQVEPVETSQPETAPAQVS